MRFSRSDCVDAEGRLFKTVGANIRHGARSCDGTVGSLGESFTEEQLSQMHTLPFMCGRGKWVTIADVVTDGKHDVGEYQVSSTDSNIYFVDIARCVMPTMLEHSVFDTSNKIRISSYEQVANSKGLSIGFSTPVLSVCLG